MQCNTNQRQSHSNSFCNFHISTQQQQAQQKLAQPQTPQQHANTNPFTQPQMMLHRSGYSMESEEGDIEDNPVHSLSSSKSNLSENSLVSNFNRQKNPRSFVSHADQANHLKLFECFRISTVYIVR